MRVRAFRRSENGSALVEFALIFPTLLLLLIAFFEFAFLAFIDLALESAASDAARFGALGQSVAGTTREDEVRRLINDGTFNMLDEERLTIETLVYPSFEDIEQPEPFDDTNGDGVYNTGEPYTDINGNGQWDPDMGAVGLGGPDDVVIYRITYNWSAITPMMEPVLGSVTLHTTVPVRNEPN